MTRDRSHTPGRAVRRRAAVIVAICGLAMSFGGLASAATPAKSPAAKLETPAKSTARPVDIASEARMLEDQGAFALAAQKLLELREVTPRDADLELAIALDDARVGRLDAAWKRLSDPLMTAALAETLPRTRYHEYGPGRWQDWTNGRWDGWHWYVARARAEVAAGLGRWDDACVAARRAVEARPLSGKDWLVLALTTARAGDLADAEPMARQAVLLDPTLPEANHLAGWFAWRAGRRAEAQESFRRAVLLDSTWRDPAIALMRSRLPLSKPDSLPRRFLHGVREVGLVTSNARPRIEELHELDVAPRITRPIYAAMPDSLQGLEPVTVAVLIGTDGRIALHELPWVDPSRVSLTGLSQVIGSLLAWGFAPAQRHGVPVATWTGINVQLPAANTP